MKWNQCIGDWKEIKILWLHIPLYASVLNWYMWWLDYMFICNHFGWNETSVLRIERKLRYHGYICIYILQNNWIDDMICDMSEWWVQLKFIWLKWNQSTRDWKEIRVLGLHMNLCGMTAMKSIWVKWTMFA